MQERITDRLTGSLNSFETAIFNASSYGGPNNYQSNLNNWIYNHLNNYVAYTVQLINPDQGVLQFTPAWVGRNNPLNNYGRYNPITHSYEQRGISVTTQYYNILEYNYGNKYYLNLNGNSQFFALSTINEHIPDLSNIVSTSFTNNILKIDISAPYQEA